MSNFQRTRSKVWWGDAPPREDPEWEPQLPHWIANRPEGQRNDIARPMPATKWPLRHGSPGSHKSQDSGFSDSDSSPPPSQHYQAPEPSDGDKSSSSSDSNNNQDITVKRADPQTNNGNSTIKSDNVSVGTPTPKPRLRSSSVIQTPYDLQKYYEIHNDEEHLGLLKDADDVNTPQKYPTPKNINVDKSDKENSNINLNNKLSNKTFTKVNNNAAKTAAAPPRVAKIENSPNKSAIRKDTKEIPVKNINVISPSKKYPAKKSFVSSPENDTAKVIKVATVKDLETSKNKSDDSLEYLKLEDNNEIAVNNLPRVRTPISNVSYVPTNKTAMAKPAYVRSTSTEDKAPISTTPKFQRNRLNKSLNFEAQKLDQQILDIQEGYHSLGFIDEDAPAPETGKDQMHQPTKAILAKNIMDSLHLKPQTKKCGPKAKQRMATRAEKTKDMFRIFPKREKEKPVADSHAGGVLDGSRVPSLGLPRSKDHDSWVIVGYPEKEMLIPHYNERLVGTEGGPDTKDRDAPRNGRVTPPPQFQDKQKTPYNADSKTDKNLTHDSKREKLKGEMDFIDVQLNLACTSTPKMLSPNEFMDGRRSDRKNARRVNLLPNFNSGVVLNNRDEMVYRERSIDHTVLERLCERKPEPVQYWLCEVVGSCENECMTTLQSKPLGAELRAQVSASSATITGNIKKVQTHGQIIVYQYSDVLRQMEANQWSEEQICLLVANINEFVLAHSISLNTKPPGETPERWDRIKHSLQLYLQRLVDGGEDLKLELGEPSPDRAAVRRHLGALVAIFLETTKAVLVQQTKTLVSIVEEPPSDAILKGTLTAIGQLALLGEGPEREGPVHPECLAAWRAVSELPFVACGVPRALLTALIEAGKGSVKALSLRALATVCVSADAVKQFEQGGGIEIISDILGDPSIPEPQKREAITVLTQITAPWLRGHYDLAQLHLYLHCIVRSITDILSRTECCQLLLLCTACLVNLVRELELERREDAPESDILEVLEKHSTVDRLLDAVKRRGPNISVFLQEQTASLLASLSRVGRSLRGVAKGRALGAALASFARTAPPSAAPARRAEERARARLHCHAAEAIARLSVMPDFARQMVELEAVPHLVRLVRLQRTRQLPEPDPDQTLLHCLKALRSLHKQHPLAFRDDEDVRQMVRPHLMESLVLFSAKKESYV